MALRIPMLLSGFKRITGCRTKCADSKNFIENGLHPNLEEAINRQVNTELSSSYAYLTLESYFRSLSVNLNGFARHNEINATDEQNHAKKLINLINERGGTVKFFELKTPQVQNWATPLDAMKTALKLENATALGLVNVIETAQKFGDIHVEHYVHDEMLNEQMECIYKVKKWINIMEACKSPECLMMIDAKLEKIKL